MQIPGNSSDKTTFPQAICREEIPRGGQCELSRNVMATFHQLDQIDCDEDLVFSGYCLHAGRSRLFERETRPLGKERKAHPHPIRA
jgi:hypothetical protein